jgi:hypothetical protein
MNLNKLAKRNEQQMQISVLEPENELAICRHNRAIVEQQLRMSVDDESSAELLDLKKELTRRIQILESLLTEEK